MHASKTQSYHFVTVGGVHNFAVSYAVVLLFNDSDFFNPYIYII